MMQLTSNQRIAVVIASIVAIAAVNIFAPGAAAGVMSALLAIINHIIEAKSQETSQ